MIAYRRGSTGTEVEKIQARLRDLELYRGPVDGVFGGGTESAVLAFQSGRRLSGDGVVGPKTWKALFDGETIRKPAVTRESLAHKVLALTGSFETGTPPPDCFAAVSGDFDGQGISFGACQWNLGQGSLQPMLEEMFRRHPMVAKEILGSHEEELRAVLRSPREEQLEWARSIQDGVRHFLSEPWRGLFRTLGRREEFQEIQVRQAGKLYRSAAELCDAYDVHSQRAQALMFDIKVQNGSIGPAVQARIRREFDSLPRSLRGRAAEEERLRIIANRRSEASNPRWIEDVRTRKLAIANGTGTVHGRHYDLEGQYGITLGRAANT
ncbi:MAG TPA: peptidoglycan-binding domain-containing protein [Candidatus Saccharimonadales bacterium]|nr:peptidoglycan-binding domain-containing protein [Candidatus Saccharimonadales bacterium]